MLLTNLKKIKHEIYVFMIFVLSRIPSLGYDMFNTDVWKWKQRIYDFGTGVFTLNFEKTIQRYHPGVSLMWIGTFAVKVFNFLYRVFTGANPPDNSIEVLFQLHAVQKFFVVLALGIVLAVIFHLLKKIIDKQYAYLALFLLILEPFYVALTRIIHLEGLQSTFMIASFLSLYLFVFQITSKKWLYASAFFSSLAILTKTSALYMIPFSVLLLFGYRYLETRNVKDSFTYFGRNFLVWLLVGLVSFVALWPALWTSAPLALETLKRGIVSVGIKQGHLQLFRGVWVEDPGILFYPLVFVFKSSLYLVIGLVGSMFIYKKLDQKRQRFILFSLLFALFYLVEISIPSKKLDRYLLPSLMSFILISSVFFDDFLRRLSAKFSKSYKMLGFVLLVPGVITLCMLHPDYFSYYSILGGGLKNGIWTIEPKWSLGQRELTYYLREKMYIDNLLEFEEGRSLKNSIDELDDKLVVAFPEKYYTQLHPFVRKIGGWATILSIKAESKYADYIIIPVWFDKTTEADPWVFHEQIFLRGVAVYNVYTNTSRYDWR